MWTHEFSIDTEAPAEAILRLFADVGHWPDWNAGTEWVELYGPFAPGTTARMKIPGEEPFPFRLTVSTYRFFANAASAVLAASSITVQTGPVPAQAPLQPLKVESPSGEAVSVTSDPEP